VAKRDQQEPDLLNELVEWVWGLPSRTRDLVIAFAARDAEFLAALRDQGPHARSLWVNFLVLVAGNLEGLMATQDPPLPAPQSPEEWWTALDDVAVRLFQRLRPLVLLSFADASARDGDGEVMSNVTKDVLFPGVVSKVGGLDEASQQVAECWLSKLEYIARDKSGTIRSNRDVRRYLGGTVLKELLQPRSALNVEPLSEAIPAPEPDEDDAVVLYPMLFEEAEAAGATAAEWALLQALRGEGTIAGAARAIGISEKAASARFRRLRRKIQAQL
jgi:hypothetical protein